MGFRIREVRLSLNMSQEQLAQKSGVSRVTISTLESGCREITTTKTLMKIAAALGVTVEDLFFGKSV